MAFVQFSGILPPINHYFPLTSEACLLRKIRIENVFLSGLLSPYPLSVESQLIMSLARPSAAQQPTDTLPPTARAIALLLASTPTVQDAQPGVLHQLLEFAHRYTSQVLSDAQVYAEHAGRTGASKIEMDDVVLAIQARVGWEFGGRVPKEVC